MPSPYSDSPEPHYREPHRQPGSSPEPHSRGRGKSGERGDSGEWWAPLFRELRQAANPENAAPMSAYMRDQFPFLGIKTPERRAISQPFMKASATDPLDWDFVEACWCQPEREFVYVACDYLTRHQRQLTPADLPRLRQFIQWESWWDTSDVLDKFVGVIVQKNPAEKDTMRTWAQDPNMWIRRVAIGHQRRFRGDTDTELLEEILVANCGSDEFFINKAIGWALREYSKTNAHWVRDFIDRHRADLSPLSVREGSKRLPN